MSDEIISFLEKHLPGGHIAGDEYVADCPSPECENPRGHFYVNLRTGAHICFHCAATSHPFQSRSLGALRKFFGERPEYETSPAADTLEQIARALGPPEAEVTAEGLPDEYRPLWIESGVYWRMAHEYVTRRGVREEDIEHYRLGFCAEGKYAGRIICPVIDDGRPTYFVARSMFGGTGRKMLNPAGPRSPHVFNPSAFSGTGDLLVCEGPFDAMALGRNAVAALGRSLSLQQLRRLGDFGGERIIIILDADARDSAVGAAMNLARVFQRQVCVGLYPKVVPWGDPAEAVLAVGRERFLATLTLAPVRNVADKVRLMFS